MKVISQSFKLKITLSSSYIDGKYTENFTDYVTFGTVGLVNKNLLSYSFDRSVENISGSFNFSFKENTGSTLSFSQDAVPSGNIMDSIRPLDIVKIYEFDRLAFIGIVTDISFAASSGNVQKRVSVSGKSLEYLFEMLQISLDVTAMSFAMSEQLNVDLKDNLLKNGTDPISVAEGIRTAFNDFKDTVGTYKEVASVQILVILKALYGSDDLRDFLVCDDMTYRYPISSNLYQDKTIKFIDFVRNLLPAPVYEIYGNIDKKGNPKMNIREVPFDSDKWKSLPCYRVPAELLTGYSFSKSCAEVYTSFLSYLEGSVVSPEYYKKAYATESGYASQDKNNDKIAVYGYRPLEVTFIGFYGGKDKDERDSINNSLAQEFKALNERLNKWYGRLDEMFSGSITYVNTDTDIDSRTGIGERVMVGKNEFYIKSEKHDWNFQAAPTITYSVDRGGRYSSGGEFSECVEISKFLGELDG